MMQSDPSIPPQSAFSAPDALLAAIINSSDDAIVSKDLNGVVMSWNRGAERIFGYTAAEMIGRSITTIIPPDRLQEEPAILARLRRGERVDHFDTRRLRKDGTLVDVSLTISPVRNAEGQVVGASKIARDVTERKRAEAFAHQQSSRLKVLNEIGTKLSAELELEPLVQAVTDAGRALSGAAFGAFFYNVVNSWGEAYTLYTLSGAPREAFEKFEMPRNTPIFAPTFAGQGVVRIADVLEDPRYGQVAPHHGMPKGHLPVRSYLAVPVASRSGEVIGGLFFGHPEPNVFTQDAEDLLSALAAQAAIAIDNSRLYSKLQEELKVQQEMERALRATEALSSSVINSSADCISIIDLDGNLVSMNPAGLSAFEIADPKARIGTPWIQLWAESLRDKVQAALDAACRGGIGHFDGVVAACRQPCPWWDVIVAPVRDQDSKVVRLTATARDVSEQRRAADKIRSAAEEGERQSRMKDEFLATLSHELRTPLQSILGWIQILRDDNVPADELKQGLEVIDRNAKSQNRIIEDLLDMSRILSGKVRLDVQRVSLAPVIEAALETVKPAAEAKGIRIQAVIDPLAKPIAGDPNRLQQVFWNLLSNAIKFTPRGGRVQVLLERVNSHLEVTVTDTGAGISPEFLPFVFERFRQADASTTRKHGGLGLGLAIVKHLIELHGGTVRAKSGGPGQGSTFITTFPLAALQTDADDGARHSRAELPGAPVPASRLDGVSVLVVDDEEDARVMLSKVLMRAGAEVRTARSAAEALELLRASIPTVLVSDIGMPEQDGFSLIEAVRALPASQGGHVPAIALTAYTRTEDRVRVFSAGFQMHLAKPADSKELLAVVESLARRAHGRPA